MDQTQTAEMLAENEYTTAEGSPQTLTDANERVLADVFFGKTAFAAQAWTVIPETGRFTGHIREYRANQQKYS